VAIEEPKFTVALKEGTFELRDYEPTVVAEVSVAGNQHDAGNKGFRLLAGYIFGGNTRAQRITMTAPVTNTPAGEKIAMTAPVTQSEVAGEWLVRFTMPRKYALNELPVPNEPKVHLKALPAARFAVARFSGLAGQAKVAAETAGLMAFAKAHKLLPSGPVSLARYNPPWTPWFLRRNEVMVCIAAKV
jgi:hypothetical protein